MISDFGLGIATFNGADRLSKTIKSILETVPTLEKERIYVIDDGSCEKEIEIVREVTKHYGVRIGEHRRNLGISATWNHLIFNLKNKRIALLNDDIILTPGWIEAIDYFLDNNENVGFVGLPCYDKEGKIFCTDNGIKRYDVDFSVPHRGLCANGFCFGFNGNPFYDYCSFDEKYYSFYEEVDLGTVLADHDLLSYNLPWPIIHHDWGATFRENLDALLPQIRMNKSREIFKSKWGGDIDHAYKKYITPVEKVEMKWLTADGPKTGMPIDVVR